MTTQTKHTLSSAGVAVCLALALALAVTIVGTLVDRNGADAQGNVEGVGDGVVDWNGWEFTYDNPTPDGDLRYDGLTLRNVTRDGLHILAQASLPVMNVYYAGNECGPFSDRLGGGNTEAPKWREFTVGNVNWLEIGVEAQIGAYFIYQSYYFSDTGLMDMHLFSGGIQCPIYHEHLPFLRLDFDIGDDRQLNDQIRRMTIAGEIIEDSEFDLPASAATAHQWRVIDAGTGDYVSISFDDGAYDAQIDGPTLPESNYDKNFVYGRLYKLNEEIWAPVDGNLNLAASRTLPGNELENIDGANGGDPVLWYTAYMPHDPDTEVAELWHSTGIRLEVHASGNPPVTPDPDTCDGQAVTVDLNLGESPTEGDDVILGTPQDDTIAAQAGNDVICGGGGDDTIWGQDGDDRIYGDDGDDKLRGGDGADLLFGGPGADDLNGGRDNDEVRGGDGDDLAVRGGTGDDYLDGGAGDDPLVSGNGGADVVIGGAGNDKVVGGPRPDDLFGDDGDDELRGLGGGDDLFGGDGNDQLFGGKQQDSLNGGPGTDDCNGGTTGDNAPEGDQVADCEQLTAVP